MGRSMESGNPKITNVLAFCKNNKSFILSLRTVFLAFILTVMESVICTGRRNLTKRITTSTIMFSFPRARTMYIHTASCLSISFAHHLLYTILSYQLLMTLVCRLHRAVFHGRVVFQC